MPFDANPAMCPLDEFLAGRATDADADIDLHDESRIIPYDPHNRRDLIFQACSTNLGFKKIIKVAFLFMSSRVGVSIHICFHCSARAKPPLCQTCSWILTKLVPEIL